MKNNFRQYTGVLIKDIPNYLISFFKPNKGYLSICNRNETLKKSSDKKGYFCKWKWTSDLYAPKIMPFLGRYLMKRSIKDYPIRLIKQPKKQEVQPDISFIIGHRGTVRLPHLLLTLQSVAAQENCSVECIVVEQDNEQLIKNALPKWVRYIHTPLPEKNYPYNRSWTFNVAAKKAKGKILVLHDNDMLVPTYYASNICSYVKQGYEVIQPKRFIFYLTEQQTHTIFTKKIPIIAQSPEAIVQNLEGGGSIAITKKAYWKIGGMDEKFIGWGGEDEDFWERCQTCKVWAYGYTILVHLWHPAQPRKQDKNNPTALRLKKLAQLSIQQRIDNLLTHNKKYYS